ncbi:hypothetical protein PGT21_031931 [Puccinia graminis f. sp. tritici]|uniref:DUF1279 domain-containing protein n=1 Tax=Puccinia graminis f. sp. tritici TaxID=56615 RepID=A0A5B0RMZ6_PUCGR|nr:hypothetical protein PGT21_031931 [Puccinia graminis f. sp. tritici]KAA1127286.1 hypothetical protein PGTUg99_034049 [Puccinia graminis f. sp. tritici]
MIRTGRIEWIVSKPLVRLYSTGISSSGAGLTKTWETRKGRRLLDRTEFPHSNHRSLRYLPFSKISSSPIIAPSPSSPSSSSSASSSSSNPTPHSIDHYPKTTSSPYFSLRSFFSKLTDHHQQQEQHDQKSSEFKGEERADPVGLFGKLRQLTKLYGSAALVVYGLLGGIDFGLSFVTIYLVGAEHVRKAEDWLLDQLNWKRAHSTSPLPSPTTTTNTTTNGEEATKRDDNNMLWTTAVVAYTIHKTILLPFRIGLTAWITPPIVRHLRKRGWKVGRNLG